MIGSIQFGKEPLMRHAIALLAGAVLFTGCANSKGHNEKEVPMTLDALPAAVRETVRNESGGAPVGKIVRETEHGKTVYEATITKDGRTYEVDIDESGKVLDREGVGAGNEDFDYDAF
jgi:peptidase YpeB-like protein